jgi:hypothetical protein
LESREAFEALLALLKNVTARSYDLKADPEGLFVWRDVNRRVAGEFPLTLTLKGPATAKKAVAVVEQIIEHFCHLIENEGLWKVLWHGGSPRREKTSQMVFYGTAAAYCKANNLDVTPEADTGSGPVDFKFSAGYNVRVLVEVKLSTNTKLVPGYQKQLAAYNKSQTPVRSFYLVVRVGRLGKRRAQLVAAKNGIIAAGQQAPEIVFVDATQKKAASKL